MKNYRTSCARPKICKFIKKEKLDMCCESLEITVFFDQIHCLQVETCKANGEG